MPATQTQPLYTGSSGVSGDYWSEWLVDPPRLQTGQNVTFTYGVRNWGDEVGDASMQLKMFYDGEQVGSTVSWTHPNTVDIGESDTGTKTVTVPTPTGHSDGEPVDVVLNAYAPAPPP